MALKTMLRQLISKWGIMSIEMQQAFEGDNSLVNEDGSFEYIEGTVTEEQPYIDTTATSVDSFEETAQEGQAEEAAAGTELFDEQAG